MTWRQTSFLIWAVLGVAVVSCQLAAVLSRHRLPGADALFRLMTAGRVRRGLVVLGWMWLGWHAFAR